MYFKRNWEFGLFLTKLRNFGGGGSSTNSVADRGQREGGSGGGSPLVGGFTKFEIE
jgi:hypothetical protein